MKPNNHRRKIPFALLADAAERDLHKRRQAVLDRLAPEYHRIRAQDPDKVPSPRDVLLLMELCEFFVLDWTVGLEPTGSPNEQLKTMIVRSIVPGSRPVARTYRVEEIEVDGKRFIVPYHQGRWKCLVLALLEPCLIPGAP